VRIYDDRLKGWNPARLPADLTVEQFYRDHASRPPNRMLAEAFYRARLIEQWGTSTLRIVSAYEAAGLRKPEYLFEMGTFVVRFHAPAGSSVVIFAEDGHNGIEPDLPQALVERLNRIGLNVRGRRAVEFVLKHGSITRSQYVELTGLKYRQAAIDLVTLCDAGIFVRLGAGRTTRYVLRP